MAYLGRGLDKISNIEVLDNITFDGSSSYSITKGSVAFAVNSAQSCLISIDGIVNATNFTVNSSTIDFGVAVPSTSVCNFFLHYGTGVMTLPSDGSVTTAKLGDNAVTTAKINDANITSAKMFSGFANGITEADKFRLTSTLSGASDGTVFTSNLERSDDATFSKIGTGMTESSGIFTYPTTGLYKVIWNFIIYTSSDAAINLFIAVSSNSGSSYDQVARGFQGVSGSLAVYNTGTVSTYVNVTNSSTFRTKFEITSVSNTTNFAGNTGYDTNSLEFIRLGDSQ